MAFEKWQKVEREAGSAENLKNTLRRLFLIFIDSQEKEVARGQIAEATFVAKRSQIINGILP